MKDVNDINSLIEDNLHICNEVASSIRNGWVDYEERLSLCHFILVKCAHGSYNINDFQKYVRSSCIRGIFDYIKRQKVRSYLTLEDHDALSYDDYIYQLIYKEDLKCISVIIENLSHKQQVVIRDFLDNKTQAEICISRQMPKSTVSKLYIDAIKNIKKYIDGQTIKDSTVVKDETKWSDDSLDHLSDRQRKVMQLYNEGKKEKEIASILQISCGQVSNFRRKALNKLRKVA